jgi:hypothetical protein
VRDVIEKHLVSHIVQKIQVTEQNVSLTRKGFSNLVSKFFKAPERNENDGMKENFKMNKSEVELRTLIDLGFIVQDYETTLLNAKYPIEDFKKIKAYKNQTHCEEIQLYARMALDGNFLARDFKELVATADKIFQSYLRGQNPSYSLTKFTIYISEIYQLLGKHREAADAFIRLTTVLTDKHPSKALFLEQTAYEYLMLKQFRKFAFYMHRAATHY